jgi:predicted porin
MLFLVSVAALPVGTARAEMLLYDKDGWTLKHDGSAQGFYSLTRGDNGVTGGDGQAPLDTMGAGWGGWDSPGADADGKFFNSRFRSGWTGSRFNWVASHVVSENTTISAVLGIAFAISTDNGPTKTDNNWDIRNAFIKIENKHWGELYIGRHVGLYTLGAIISTINSTSASLGYGHGCSTGGDGLGCYTSGYGVRFPGFWSGVQYQTPDLHGLRIKVAALDPETAGVDSAFSVEFSRRPLPMFQGLVRYEGVFGSVKVIPFFNTFAQMVGQDRSRAPMIVGPDTLTPFGIGGWVELHIAGLKVGGGGTIESGTSFYGPLYTPATVIDGAGKLRPGSNFFAHALYSFETVDISAGYGQANISQTDDDKANDFNFQKVQSNTYGAFQYHFDKNLTFIAELNVLHHGWVHGNKQNVQVINLGSTFSY